MGVVGITAEYNPFHHGHAYHLRKSLELGGDEGVVVVMSGDFVQRGSAAVFSKFARAEAAVRCGASLVLELPVPWALSSAEGFARGAVSLLKATGVVDIISFGCESGDIAALRKTAEALLLPELDEQIARELKSGLSYAAAREQAVLNLAGEKVAECLRRPNDLLAIEYLKACTQLDAAMKPLAIHRSADSVHDGVGSASELRAAMEQGMDYRQGIPAHALEVYDRESRKGRGPVTSSDLCLPILSRLRTLTAADFAAVPDASEGIENRLYEAVRREITPEAVAMAAKSKRYALSRLRRMTTCAALGVRREDSHGLPPYIRVLAMDDRGKGLLRRMNESASLPVIVKPASVRDLDDSCQRIFDLGSAAHDLYVLGYKDPETRRGGSDWRTTPYIK